MNHNIEQASLTNKMITKIKDMNDKQFIQYVKENYDIIENIINSIPKNMYNQGQIHPTEIFDIIVAVNSNDENDIDPKVLQKYLVNINNSL